MSIFEEITIGMDVDEIEGEHADIEMECASDTIESQKIIICQCS